MKNRKKTAYIFLLLIIFIYIFSKVRTSYIFYCSQNDNSINNVNSELKESNTINIDTIENTKKLLKTEFNINKLYNGNNILIQALNNYSDNPDNKEYIEIIYLLLSHNITVDNNRINPIQLVLITYDKVEYLKKENSELVKVLISKTNSINNFEDKKFSPYNMEIFQLLNSKFNLKKSNFFINLNSISDISFLKFLINNQYISKKNVYSYSKLLNDRNYFEKFTPSDYIYFPSKYAKKEFKCTTFMKLVSASYISEDNVKLILDNNKNLNLNLQDTQGNTIIFYCIANNKFLNLFLKENVDLKKQNNLGITALMFASMKNNIKQIALLQNKENTLELRDKREYTALSWAVYLDNFDSVEYLIKIGSNKYVKDIYGNSLLEICNSKKMKKFLQKYM